jgi:2-polyprenyl-3-methyl-5-hydroxy-6-metoxy-1,4-benzoquinol methylase
VNRLFPRRRVAELMDDPALDEERHRQALRGLASINWWSRSAASLWPALESLIRTHPAPLRVLDVACGAGDNVVALAKRAQRRGLLMSFSGCDVSSTALTMARQRAECRGVAVDFFKHDALAANFPGEYEVVLSSLFLHHLEEADALRLLQGMARAAKSLVLVNDLRRCRMGYWAAQVVPRLLTRSPIVHVDAPRSVEAAFTPEEGLYLAKRAGLQEACVQLVGPWRWQLIWHHAGEALRQGAHES